MEYAQALEYLKILRSLVDITEHDSGAELQRQTYDVAIEAVEKQILKNPDYEADGYDNNGELIYDTWICPNCEKRYEVDCDSYDYCPNCGQAIDWSDRNE